MALANYTDLQTSIADILHRSDLTTQIVDFINMAEAKINRTLRANLMEVDQTVTLTSGTRTIALPARFIEPIALDLVITGQNYERMIPVLADQLPINASLSTRPRYYTINGANIEFANLSDATYTMRFRMRQGYSISTTTTNTLLTNNPDVYLYGACLYAAPYMIDDDRIPVWKTYYTEAMNEIKRLDARTKSNVDMRSENMVRSHANILTGE